MYRARWPYKAPGPHSEPSVFTLNHQESSALRIVILGDHVAVYVLSVDYGLHLGGNQSPLPFSPPEQVGPNSPPSPNIEERSNEDIPPLEEGKVWVRYHPASNQRSGYLVVSSSQRMQTEPCTTSHPIHSPFRTHTDFLQAEIFSKYNVSDKHIDAQLKMLHETGAYKGDSHSPLTLKSAADYHEVMRNASGTSEKFRAKPIKTSFKGKVYHHIVHSQPALPALMELVGDPELANEFIYHPEQRFIRRSEDDPNPIIVVEELHHGADWWELQNAIGCDEHILFIVVYVDETNVTTFGGVKVWPVYAWLGNLPAATRLRRNRKGGAILIGYLPEANPQDNALNDSDLAELRVRVYHDALEAVFESLALPSQCGVSIKCGDGQTRKFRPVIGAISADYKELCRITCILGHKSGFPCPICLVPRLQQGDLVQSWPNRTVNGSEALILRASKERYIKDRDEILSEQSLRTCPNIFHDIIPSIFSVYLAVSADPLHQIEQGIFGKHLWPWLRELLSNDKKSILDGRFRKIPRYPDLKHFPNGVTKLQNVTGKEHAVILRLLAPLVEDLLPSRHNKLISAVFRSLAEIHMLAKFTTHTEDSLQCLASKISEFSPLYAKLASHYPAVGSDYPKVHSLSHLVDIIRRKGPTDNYHTGLGEALHPQSKRDYQHTNHQETFKEQMLRTYQERELITRIRAGIDYAAESLSNEANTPNTPGQGSPVEPDSFQHATVAGHSYRMAITTFAYHLHQNDTGALHFVRELRTFLYQEIDGLGEAFHFRERNLPPIDHTIMDIFPSLKVSYISLLDSRDNLDILRATDSWRGKGPRHDYVLFNDQRGLSVAQVLSIFKIQFRDKQYEIAYIRPLPIQRRSKKAQLIHLEMNKSIRNSRPTERALERWQVAEQTGEFENVLAVLWYDVDKPILDSLGYSNTVSTGHLPHITWCPTGPLSFLPLPAAGDYDRPGCRLFDYVVSSYTPTITALLTSTPRPLTPDSRILAVGQANTPGHTPFPGTTRELAHLKAHTHDKAEYSELVENHATTAVVLDAMEHHNWVHLTYHAHQNVNDPTRSGFFLHDGTSDLASINRRPFKNKGPAFLSACQMATGDQLLPDKAIHLASGMLMAGYPSVVATMWSVMDNDAPFVADNVYGQLMKDRKVGNGETGKALHYAVAALHDKVGEKEFGRWVPYIHIGS
ncbi:hypothetical protein FRC11_003923 [Ceratobasidium sp. 423]|nr:hypothetical protein FRC11_003923 [Ceratobasidium sp. 423]